MRVVLHIGTEKTGTSTIQEYLLANSAALLKQGVLSPDSARGHRDTANHFRIAMYGRRDDRPDDLVTGLGITSMSEFREDFQRALRAEVQAKPAEIMVLCSEHCSARLHFDDELERVRSLLSEFGEIQIVLYLRRQDALWASYYSTLVKNNETRPFAIPPRELWEVMFDYRWTCDRWARVFGKDALAVRVFSGKGAAPDALIDDFFTAANIEVDRTGFVDPERHNQALDWQSLEFLRRFNRHLPAYPAATGHRLDIRQGDLLQLLDVLSSERRIHLPAEDRQVLLDEFAEGNAYVARTYLGREDGVLFPSGRAGSSLGQPQEFTMEHAFELFAKLWAAREEAARVRLEAATRERQPEKVVARPAARQTRSGFSETFAPRASAPIAAGANGVGSSLTGCRVAATSLGERRAIRGRPPCRRRLRSTVSPLGSRRTDSVGRGAGTTAVRPSLSGRPAAAVPAGAGHPG